MKLYRGTTKPPSEVLQEGFKPIHTIMLGNGEDELGEIPTYGIFLSNDPILASMFGKYVYEVCVPNQGLLERIETVGDFEYLYKGPIAPKHVRFYGTQESMLERRSGLHC